MVDLMRKRRNNGGMEVMVLVELRWQNGGCV